MKNMLLNIIATALALLTEAWIMRLFGVKKWDDILEYIVASAVVPIIIFPWKIFRMWLGYIFGESSSTSPHGNHGRHNDAETNRQNAAQREQKAAEQERFSEEMRARREQMREEEQKRAEVARRTFLYFMAALSAKVAKADGHVDATEIAVIERTFERLGLSGAQRQYCIDVFRRVVNSDSSVSEIAEQLNASSLAHELKSIIYEILWNIACADGVLTVDEKAYLKLISNVLGLNSYEHYYQQRVKRDGNAGRADEPHGSRSSGRMTLDDAYSILGCSATSTDAAVKSAYREKAKRNHPDALRAQGLPESMIDVATRRMAEINAAWDVVNTQRHL